MDFGETQISENFWSFEQKHVRCFLFRGEPYSLLVDSCYTGNLRKLCEQKTGNPVRLLLTHADRDHIGCMEQFPHRTMHPAEFSVLSAAGVSPAGIHPIWDGDTIDIGTFRFTVLHLPGHSPGCIALLEKQKRFLLAGDIVQTGPIYLFGGQRNIAAYAASINRLRELRSSFDTCYSSHYGLRPDPNILNDLYDLADEMTHGICPEALPLPNPLPPSVPADRHLYVKGLAHFYF